MSKKVLKLTGKRPMLLALIIVATFMLGLIFSGWFTPTPSKAQNGGPNPQPNVENNCGTNSDGTCTECGPHWGDWVADSCPSITNTPGSATEICQKVGDAPYVDVIPPIYNTGSKHRTGTFDCSSNTTNQTGTITYTVSGVTWDPALPTKFTAANVPTFTSTAYVDVTSSDPSLCSDGTGHKSFATCTWLVHNTNQPCAPSSSVTLNAYFASDSVGYRLYAHTFTEFYTKIYSCSDPKEQWHLTLSTASLKAYHMDDTYTWGETHQYSFQTGSTAMSEAYGIGEEGTDYDQLSEDFLVSPQSGLTGTAAASLTWNNDDGGGTPGIIISGGSITISIQ